MMFFRHPSSLSIIVEYMIDPRSNLIDYYKAGQLQIGELDNRLPAADGVGKYGCGCGSVTLDGDGTRPENKLILLTSQPRHFLRQVEGPGV